MIEREALAYIAKNTNGTLMMGAEIGVRKGLNAVNMLENMNVEHLYLVDPYLPYEDSVISDAPNQSAFYAEMFHNLHPFKEKVTMVHRTSKSASMLFPDEYFNFVYIDADHAYKMVKLDCESWLPKVKRGDYLCGHDYGHQSVKDAVAWFVEHHADEVEQIPINGADWLLKRKQTNT